MAVWKIKERNELVRANEIRGDRQLHMGGGAPGNSDVVDFANMTSTGDFSDFGNLSAARSLAGGGANQTRSLCTGGQAPGVSNVMDYVQIKSTGNFGDFGDLTDQRGYVAGMSNDLRQITTGGLDPSHSNIMDVVSFASTGNAVDFGNLTNVNALHTNSGSPTRGINAGGVHNPGSVTNLNIIDFITFVSNGNATDFGDLTATQRSQSSFSSKTRMCIAGGQAPGTTKIEKIEIATTGNATDFADALAGTTENGRGTSNNKRGVFQKGAVQNVLETKNIFDSGTAVDFGDLTVARTTSHAASDCHGGLELEIVQRPSVTYMPGSGRGLLGGGKTNPAGTNQNAVQMIHIQTLGNTSDFGDLTIASYGRSGCASRTRGVFGGGYNDPAGYLNVIESIEFASQGNAADFGNSTVARAFSASNAGSQTRGIIGAGGNKDPGVSDVIDYITIASAGNAADFGNLSAARTAVNGFSSPTRGVFAMGHESPADVDTVEYITIASTGNVTDFGNSTSSRQYAMTVSTSIRGVSAGGFDNSPSNAMVNIMDYVTIATTGNSTDFGDLTVARGQSYGGMSDPTRGVFGGGTNPDNVTIDYITIASTGNAADFGDMSLQTGDTTNVSDSHGGLQS